MSEFGYIPEAPEQSFGNNKGIFTPKDIYDLTRVDKYTNYGQLELIETQNVSGVSAIDFTNIKENEYNVHFVTANNMSTNTDQRHLITRFSTDGGSSFISSGYQQAQQYMLASGSFGEHRSTSQSFLNYWTSSLGLNEEVGNAYMYLYNLGDSTKYSFSTEMSSDFDYLNILQVNFGSSVYPQANVVNAIRFEGHSSTSWTGSISLYGIKEYS